MPVTEERLRDIAAEATRSVYPPERIGEIFVESGVAFNGDEAYHFVVHVEQADDRDEAADKRTELRRKLRDRLTSEGDDTFPFVRILDRAAVA